MGDNIDRKVFEEMVQITDPFDPLFAPKVGKTAEVINKELQDKWMEENVVKLIAPDLSRAPLMTLRGGKSLFSKKAFEAYQKALDRLRKVVKWGDVKGTVRVHDIASKGKGPHYRSDPEQYFTDKEWSKLELSEYRDMFAKFIREERKLAGIGKPEKSSGWQKYRGSKRLSVKEELAEGEMRHAGYKHDIYPQFEDEYRSDTVLDIIKELRKLQN